MRLLVGGADQTINDNDGYDVPPKQQRDSRTPNRPHRLRNTPRELAQDNNHLAEYGAVVAQVRPPHSRALLLPVRRARHALPRMHDRSTDWVPRRTPRHPRHDVRVALRDPPLPSDGRRPCGNVPASPRTVRKSAAHAAVTGM